MVSRVKTYYILEPFATNDSLRYFVENDLEYVICGMSQENEKILLIFTAQLSREDVLFLNIKYPELIIKKKIST